MKKTVVLFLLVVLSAMHVLAGTNPPAWSSSPFNQQVFIENKGQFDKEKRTGKVLFASAIEGVEFFFSRDGITFKHTELVAMEEEEKEKLKAPVQKTEKKRKRRK